MQVLNIAEVGEVKLRKLSKRDWELIRNKCIVIDATTKQETTVVGSFIKYLNILGIEKAPFFTKEYLPKARLSDSDITLRESEYYDNDLDQKVFDVISQHIREFNIINEPEIKEVSKKLSNT